MHSIGLKQMEQRDLLWNRQESGCVRDGYTTKLHEAHIYKTAGSS